MVKHVKFHLNRFLRRVRIHGGEFDTSARAMYRVSEKGSLISYEKAFSTRADLRIVRGSTIERKQMSTKTTFKRIALVTVAALGLGVLSVAPSSAVPQADKLTLAATTASTTQGTAVSVNATLEFSQETSSDTMTLTLGYVSAPTGFSTADVHFTNPATAVTTDLPAGVTTDTSTSSARVAKISAPATAYVSKTLAVTLKSTAKVGTYVIRVTPADNNSATTALSSVAQNITFTVAAKTIGSRSAFIGVTGTLATDTQTADATAASLTFDGKAATGAKARLDVAQMYGTTGNDTATAADGGAVVVTIDKGLVSRTNDYSAGAASVTTPAATSGAGGYAAYPYWIFANGTVGKATITITVGGVALTSKTVQFTGAATALVATKGTGANDATWIAVGTANSTVAITATDSSGGAATALPTGLTVTSSDTSVATATISSGTVTITGVKAGTAVLTIKDPATTSAATSATYAVTVKAVRPTTAPTITFDKAAYNVGEVITMTVNADMADSATASALFTTALVTSAGVTAVAGTTALSTSSAAHAIVGGVATYKFYAPAVSGSFTVTGKTGATVDITTAVDVSKTVDIVNPGVDAATAAAELAEAAAQDATDAALDATEAATLAGALAQEAVDAVADLSTQVATLIAALKKQITTLTNLVIKIQKKVRA
jgi:trimeric autotransporter adhesin